MLTRGVLALWKCIHISYRGAKNAFRKLVFVRQSRAFREKCLVYIRHYLEQIPVWALELVRIIKLLHQKLFDFKKFFRSEGVLTTFVHPKTTLLNFLFDVYLV